MTPIDSQIRFLGTGGIFDYRLGNASAVVDLKMGRVLIDCGFTVYERLCEKGLIDSIDYLLLTHLHGDHTGSIHPLLLYWAFVRKRKVFFLYPTESFKKQVLRYMKAFLACPEDYLDFAPIRDYEELGFLRTKGHHMPGLESFAYTFRTDDHFIYFSGDLGDAALSATFLKTIRHEHILVFHDTTFFKTHAHAHYQDIERHLAHYQVYHYHCNHLIAPKDHRFPFAADAFLL